MTPTDLLYTKEHEWLRIDGDSGVIGITDHAQKELGDIVYIELPKPGVTFDSGEVFGSVESVKAVSDVYSPVSGIVLEINDDLRENTEMINGDPYGDGWMVKIEMPDPTDLDDLLGATEYEQYVAEQQE